MQRRYASARAFAAALDARLRALASERVVPIDRLRREVAYERFLARLQAAAPGEWLLKGGVALDLRFPIGAARRTNDVDIETTTTHVNVERARSLLQRAARVDLDDYFVIRVANEPARELIEGTFAYRFGMEALLDDRVYTSFKCDVAMGNEHTTIEKIQGRSLLDFAGIESPAFEAVPLSRHIAEKTHAYTQDHSGVPSSRVKDLVDLALLAANREVGPAGDVRGAIDETFAERGRSAPATLPDPPENWKSPYMRLASGLDVPSTAAEAFALVRSMLNPILAGDTPAQSVWRADTGWSAEPTPRRDADRSNEDELQRGLDRDDDYDLGL